MVSSDPLLDEIEEKLVIKFKRPVSIAAKARRIVRRLTEQQAVSLFEKTVCRDPDDDWILATAVAGECEYLVTGDKDLLALGRFNNVRILRPAEFGALIGFLSR